MLNNIIMDSDTIPSEEILQEENEMEHPNHEPEDESRVLNSTDINGLEHDIIKGDTVGETLYSAKWILNTLISLSKVYEDGWNESMENDLCMLWDMTAEKDIVDFLIENDFFKMAEFTLKTSEEPRQTEIIVGIIGNMCCDSKALDILVNSDELVTLIMSLIISDDKETLIQVLRILQAAVWDVQKNNQSPWLKKVEECEILGEAICFILKSSTSDDLLTPTIDFVNLISDIEIPNKSFVEDVFNVDELIFALCESMMELIIQTDNSHTESQIKNIGHWLNVIFNISVKNLLRFSDSETDENFTKINEVMLKILKPYLNLSNLTISDDKCLHHIQQCIEMVLSFQKNELTPNTKLIQTILTIMINLKIASTGSDFDDVSSFQQLYECSKKYWVETLKTISKDQIMKIFQSSEHETVNDIIEITESLSEIDVDSKNELLNVKETIFCSINNHK